MNSIVLLASDTAAPVGPGGEAALPPPLQGGHPGRHLPVQAGHEGAAAAVHVLKPVRPLCMPTPVDEATACKFEADSGLHHVVSCQSLS